jgi:two-component system, cell cycle response regulator
LIAGTIWRFGGLINVDLSPMLLAAISIQYLCFPVSKASLSVSLILVMAAAAFATGKSSISIVLWIPVFGTLWGLIFWHLRREREWFRSKFQNIENRARGLMLSPVSEETEDGIPDLADETRVAKAAASVFRMNSLVDKIIEIISEIMHPNSCFFFLLDQEAGYLKILSFRSKSKFFNSEATLELDSKGLLAWVVQNKKPIRHERLPRLMQWPTYYSARERILSCMIFPVLKDRTVEGLLGVDSHRSHSFGLEEAHLMELFANLIGAGVDAYRLYQQKDFHADYMKAFYSAIKKILETKLDLGKRLDLLIEISIMMKKSDEVAIALPADEEKFIIRKATGTYFEKLIGATVDPQSLVGGIISKNKDVAIIDAIDEMSNGQGVFSPSEPTMKIYSMMVIPLPMEDRIMGVLVLSSRRKEYYTHNDRFVFGSLAAQFGFALENALNVQRIEQLAITDGLTACFNHRYFQDSLSREIKRSKRDNSPVSLLMVDIDHFKKFNDTYGHQAGDEVLKNIARLLREQAREVDLVARYGGEEFAVILVNCEIKMAGQIAERIRKSCSKMKIAFGNQDLSVTMSLGVANFPTQAQQPDELISMADRALYQAKALGRDRVVISQPETPPV